MTHFDVLFSGISVTHFENAVPWYSRLFGRDCDIVVHDHEVMWRLSAAGWLYVVQDPPRAGGALVALAVPDLGQMLSDIGSRGLECGTVEMVGDSGRKATIEDADGNAISFIEVNGS